MPDGLALASSVMGMDHMLRTFVRSAAERLSAAPRCTLWEAVRMATLTPARIAGWDHVIGSLEPGKFADVLVLDRELHVRRVFVDGKEL
jgi:N-acetylglucosamine-6-phosphate deacetylase